MVRNEKKYQEARVFRQRGFSYSEIAKIVGVSKATLSNWLGNQTFSKSVRKDNEAKARKDNVKRIELVNKTRRIEQDRRYKEAVRSSEIEIRHYKASSLFVSGLMIYLSVGDLKHPTQIRLPSQRLAIHGLFIRFLKAFLGIERSKIYSKLDVTIVNDAIAKKKLMAWIDRLPRIVLNG